MIELAGKFNTAKIFTDNAEQSALHQIKNLLDREFAVGSRIRIMPDMHAGMGAAIGTTMTVTDKIVPNLVGVDIGCGMETVVLKDRRVELSQLDKIIKKYVPSGFGVRAEPHRYNNEIDLSELLCAKHVDLKRASLSVGTLGGGNHFIELGADESGALHLVVHSGSRNLGKQVCEHYQKMAAESPGCAKKGADRALAYLEGRQAADYLHDMAVVQRYADLNRKAVINELEKHIKFKIAERFTTVHNYIDLDSMILRKGAISARAGERVLIPMNMRDGSLVCVGKGNEDWNYSAPHGAGRVMSRSAARESVTLTQYQKAMEGIYSTTVSRETLDEAPFAYKPPEEIIKNIGGTCEIISVIKPLFNFKAAE